MYLFAMAFEKSTSPALLHKPAGPWGNQDGTVIQKRGTQAPSTQILQATPPSPYLVVLFPLELNQSIDLGNAPSFILGRSQETDISIPDELVSRHHCEISWDGRHVTIQDLGSTNGTFVDGLRLEARSTREIGPENRLQVGNAILKVDFKDSGEIEREKALFEAATTDALTKVPNRRFFLDRARAEWSAAKRVNRFLHAILLDVDFFKKVNDTWGHPAGDFVLKEVASVLGKVRREEDQLARWGGEEFIFLVTGIEPAQALAFTERARKAIEMHRIVWNDQHIPVTISLGLASVTGKDGESLDNLIAQADKNLYQAKRNGRNCIWAG